MERVLVVTLDTEVDKSPSWAISSPARFTSVIDGVPRVLSPLFERHGVRPTYFLSPEVIEDTSCVEVLRRLEDRVELGTHLHPEFIEPERTIFPEGMAGRDALAIQRQYPREIEAAKLKNLTELFQRAFGRAPRSFRAGRYGMSDHTHEILAGLGYLVDSSVTPGLRWDYPEGVVDFRSWGSGPRWVDTGAGRLLELPVSVRDRWSTLARLRRRSPFAAGLLTRAIGDGRTFAWLRPSWHSGRQLIDYVERSDEPVLVMMLHSMEIIAGASPYARDEAGVRRIVAAMETLFAHCRRRGIVSCTAAEAADRVRASA